MADRDQPLPDVNYRRGEDKLPDVNLQREQPPIPEHMILHSGCPSQWLAPQLWPSSCDVRATRDVMLEVNFDCDTP